MLIGVGILAAAAWFVWFRPPSPAPVPMPNPNGYDDFVKAGRLLVNKQPGWWDLNHDKLRAYVLPNAEALRLVRVGLGRQCRVPIEYSTAHYWVLSNNRMSFKSLAQALSAEGTLAVMEQRTNDAAIAYLDIVRLGHESYPGGLLLDGIIASHLAAMKVLTEEVRLITTTSTSGTQVTTLAVQRASSAVDVDIPNM